jgi:hypothetical protein
VKNESEYTVHLQKDGVTESFAPGDEIPAWAAKRITNPLVTGDAVEEDGVIKEKPGTKKAPARKAASKTAPKDEPEESDPKDDSGS